jgi:hypothetical protein
MVLRTWIILSVFICAAFSAQGEAVKMEKVNYQGWENSIRLSNDEIELVATTDVGPRIIRFGFTGGQNIFKEYPEQMGRTGDDEWNIYGGHRLWHAPEAKPRTYWPDNFPIEHKWDGKTLILIQGVEETTGIAKEMEVTLSPDSNHVKVVHRLINKNMWPVDLAVWAMTVTAQNGRVIVPQEPYRAHTDYLLPARPMVLWHYTNMADPRWTWGEKYIQLRQDPAKASPQKIGVANSLGWAALTLRGDVFIKRYSYVEGGEYPDWGCNTETFTNDEMLEVETLGPLTTLDPEEQVEHVEHWFLFKADVGTEEESIDKNLLPLIRQTDAHVE